MRHTARSIAAIAAIAAIFLSGPALADAPAIMPVQGFATDTAGAAVAGTHDMRFRIYTTPSGGVPVYDETIPAVDIAEGLFSVELGNVTPLDLGLFDVHSSLFLGITIDDDVELSPRVVLGTVPWAAFAANATNAETLGGLGPEDFRLVGEDVPFTEVSGVPADLLDGDDDTDTLGGLSCIAGDIAFFDGAQWTCLPLADTACGVGEVVTGFDTAGNIVCDPPVDEGVRGQTCPANQFMRGVNADGTLECATIDAQVRTYINANCFIYVGWADNCEAGCDTPEKMGRVNGNVSCTTALGGASDDSTCDTQVNIVGTIDVETLGTNFNGDVDGNDKLFVGFHCE